MSGRSYRLPPRDGTGVFLGLSVVECCLLAAGFAGSIALRMSGAPVTAAACPLVATALVAKAKVGGRPLHQWVGLLCGWFLRSLAGDHRWRGPLPLLPSDGAAASPPPVLAGLDVVEVPGDAGGLAAVRDRRRARLTVVLPVASSRFAGEDAAAQDAFLSGWGDALAAQSAAGTGVVQVGWSRQATPGSMTTHRSWLATIGPVGGERGDDDGTYDDVVAEVAGLTVEHDTVVWLTVSGAEVPGKGRPLDRAAAQVADACDALAGSLRSAGLDVGEPLPVAGLWRLLRRRSDPFGSGAAIAAAGTLAERMGLADASNGHPLAIDTSWSELHVDGSWHRLYWVEAWPRRPVPADWLSAFLAESASSTLTVLHRPISAERSQRRVDSRLVALTAHRERKERRQRRVTELDHRTEDAASDLEAELASGYAEMLYLGLLCVSAPERDLLEDECRAAEHAARSAQLSIRVLHGRQDTAWAASLPFGIADPGVADLVGL